MNKHKENLKELREECSIYNEFMGFDKTIYHNLTLAKEYAQLAIKYMFLLNGGAILLVPTLTQAYNIPFNNLLFLSVLSFMLGLFFIVLACLFAFFSTQNGGEAAVCNKRCIYEGIEIRLFSEYYNEKLLEEKKTSISSSKEKSKNLSKKMIDQTNTAIFFGILSLCSFCLGGGLFLALMNGV